MNHSATVSDHSNLTYLHYGSNHHESVLARVVYTRTLGGVYTRTLGGLYTGRVYTQTLRGCVHLDSGRGVHLDTGRGVHSDTDGVWTLGGVYTQTLIGCVHLDTGRGVHSDTGRGVQSDT